MVLFISLTDIHIFTTTRNTKSLFLNAFDLLCCKYIFQNVIPDPTSHCGPYSPDESLYSKNIKQTDNKRKSIDYSSRVDKNCHDTIGMIVIDDNGNVAAGTTTNGACCKIPGYVQFVSCNICFRV